jgi:hypothetical protein
MLISEQVMASEVRLISDQFIDLGWQDEPRDSKGRWTRFGGVGAAIGVMEKEREGFSVSPRTGESPTSGYMVALDGHTHRYPAEILDDPAKLHKAIDDMLISEKDSFQGKDMFLGGWVEDGKLWLDPSQNVQDRATAEQLGKARDQVGVFDLNTFNTINTGGSGGGRIIDHANQGPRGDPLELLGPAGGPAPGGGGEDRERCPFGIAAQVQFIDLGYWEGWRTEPRDRHGRWTRFPGEHLAEEALRGVTLPHLAQSQGMSAEQQVAWGAVQKASVIVPDMFAAHDHLDWDGKPPTIYPPGTDPRTLADIDWNGHVSMQASVADSIVTAMSSPSAPIEDANSFMVPLHELIHAVLPDGQSRRTNGDKQAYQDDIAHADIEEGFTELGSIQHAADFFDQLSVGDRKVLDAGPVARQQHLADINGLPFTPDMTATKTMDDVADEINTPARIKSGNAYGHYKIQTAQAYNWVSTIAQMHTGQAEDSEATQDEITRLSDAVNAVGAAAKPTVMADHVISDMGLSGPIRDTVLQSTAQSILGEWGQGTDASQVVTKTRRAALQQVQQLRTEQERQAA